jgi:hypothetical protein
MNYGRVEYVIAIMHCSLLLACAHKEATRALKAESTERKRRHNDSAEEFIAQADRISVNVLGQTASDLL